MTPIGQVHAAQQAALRAALADLAEAAPPAFAEAFETQIARLDGWSAKIAAIGQVKAGKSSTLNALIGDVGFLPADVNPWTSVVTNMRINLPGDPKTGARFDFFDEASWNRIINGDPAVRKAAETFLPGFDAEVLRAQTEEMRRIAEQRLGPSYTKLLGSHHDYDLLSGELLQHYVCAGPGIDEASRDEATGRYSALTRDANLFMRSDDYAVPTIVTDTPGVNDPFLVRDEFTCQSLDRSDIFLVMLSAHQALTEVDIALIRMLAMQGEKDVLIYVNRVDELEDAARRVRHVVADVEARLQEAIPERRFSIRFGSAWWAEAALDTDLADDELRRLIRQTKVDEFLALHRTGTPEGLREKLMLASGIPAIRQALSDAIDRGTGARLLADVSQEAKAQVAAIRATSRRQRHELQDRIDLFATGETADFREALEDEMAVLAETHTALAELIEESNDAIDTAINDDWVALQRAMGQEIARFIKAQRPMIDKLGKEEASAERAEIDLLPLRIALEDGFHERYTKTREALDATLHETMAQAIAIARKANDAFDAHISLGGLPGETVAVTFATSRKTLSLDVTMRRGWAFWKGRQVDADRTMEGLRRVTAAEVFPATNKMVEAFTNTLADRAVAGKNRLGLVVQVVEQSLNDRIVRLREDRKILGGDRAEEAKSRLLNRLHNDIEIIDNRLQLIAAREGVLADPAAEAA